MVTRTAAPLRPVSILGEAQLWVDAETSTVSNNTDLLSLSTRVGNGRYAHPAALLGPRLQTVNGFKVTRAPNIFQWFDIFGLATPTRALYAVQVLSNFPASTQKIYLGLGTIPTNDRYRSQQNSNNTI